MYLKVFIFQIECGTRANYVKGLIHGGNFIDRGEYPWYVNKINKNNNNNNDNLKGYQLVESCSCH